MLEHFNQNCGRPDRGLQPASKVIISWTLKRRSRRAPSQKGCSGHRIFEIALRFPQTEKLGVLRRRYGDENLRRIRFVGQRHLRPLGSSRRCTK